MPHRAVACGPESCSRITPPAKRRTKSLSSPVSNLATCEPETKPDDMFKVPPHETLADCADASRGHKHIEIKYPPPTQHRHVLRVWFVTDRTAADHHSGIGQGKHVPLSLCSLWSDWACAALANWHRSAQASSSGNLLGPSFSSRTAAALQVSATGLQQPTW